MPRRWLRQQPDRHDWLSGYLPPVTASVGTAWTGSTRRPAGPLIKELLNVADMAMYRAKRNGGNRSHHHGHGVEADPPLYSYKVRCGFAGPRAPRNHLFLGLDPAAGNPTDERQGVRDHLTALVRAWEPKRLSVCTYTFRKAQQHSTPQIGVGWLTYIRDDVPMDTRVLSRTVTVEFADGGRYLTLSGTALEPHLGGAMSVRWALGLPSHGQRFTVS